MDLLSNSLGVLGTVLQVVLLYLLLRGPFSRYFPLFLYVLTYAIASGVEGWVLRNYSNTGNTYFRVYWANDLGLHLLLFLMVIQLTTRALENHPLQKTAPRLMAAIVGVVILIPFVLFDSPVWSGRWNTSVSQLLSFAAGVMNLVLWTALIVTKSRDRQLLAVSAGLGILVAGEAVTFGAHYFTNDATLGRALADWAHRLFFLASTCVWCWAFLPARNRAAEPTVSAG